MRKTLSSSLLLSALLIVRAFAAQHAPPPDEIFVGSFITLDTQQPRAEAVAVRDGQIVAVGSRENVQSLAVNSTRQTVLPGVALPGFTDAHAHPLFLGELLESLDLARLSKEEILQRVRKESAAAASGAWIRGSGWDQEFWRPPAYPTAAELDSVSADHPVMFDRVDGHAVWANTRALQLAGISRESPDPTGGKIVRDARGEPSGILIDSAMDLVTRVVPAASDADVERRLRAALANTRSGASPVYMTRERLCAKSLPTGNSQSAAHFQFACMSWHLRKTRRSPVRSSVARRSALAGECSRSAA